MLKEGNYRTKPFQHTVDKEGICQQIFTFYQRKHMDNKRYNKSVLYIPYEYFNI